MGFAVLNAGWSVKVETLAAIPEDVESHLARSDLSCRPYRLVEEYAALVAAWNAARAIDDR